MTENSKRSVGFDRKILLPWIDAVADWMAAGESNKSIREKLDLLLEGKVAGDGSGSAKGKTITVLSHVWVSVPDRLKPLRDEGLALLRHQSGASRLALHWGMCLATYPFFKAVADTVGRLLRLQGVAGAAQVRRRVQEQFGERQIVARGLQHVLRTFVEWGVLQDTTEKGVYRSGAVMSVNDPNLSAWLIEAILTAGGTEASVFQSIVRSPALFPFEPLTFNVSHLNRSERLEYFRQGLDEDVVMLRRPQATASVVRG
jgi:hypothetical protein